MLIYRMQMKYADGGENIVSEALKQSKITCHENYAKADFESLNLGDIVFIHAGSHPKALVKIIDRIPDADIKQPSFGIDYRVEILSSYDDAIKEFPEIEFRPPHVSTFVVMDINNDTYKKVKKWYSLIMTKKQMENYISLLKQKHQIIFTGAPGTGKTYLAREIADKMIGNAEKANIQTSFVQLHPSYDYTDFVEGLRPVQKGSQIDFELKNGAFKEFCRVAGVVERLKVAGKTTIEQADLATFLGEDTEGYEFWNTPEYVGKEITEIEKDLPEFVFIIDEVNRAEISKVFGELMFSIDEGYRGTAGKVKTQYANIQTDATFFTNKNNDYFFVPSNVYIIGTMNDIDRSVETFDFAMRRRFAWCELKVEDTQDSILKDIPEPEKALAIEKLKALNNAILSIQGLNSGYCIGASYFGKLKKDNSFNNLWIYHLAPLLREYLRGLPNAEEKLVELKTAYDNAKS